MKTAWFLGHRIRTMRPLRNAGPLGGSGMTVEADETELAKSRKTKRPEGHRRRPQSRVLSLVERGGNVRSMWVDHRMINPLVRRHVHKERLGVNDEMRAAIAVQGAAGKRLTYQTANSIPL